MIVNVLSIAGSDPSGGAGIQADLKTFGALGGYGMAAITALTAQNTRGVFGIVPVAPEFVAAQVEAILADIRVDAIKIGMVGSAAVAETLGRLLVAHPTIPVVVDPVLAATSGDALAARDVGAATMRHLAPRATLLTPNLDEAAALADLSVAADVAAMENTGRALLTQGANAVLVKGGHLASFEAIDVLCTAMGCKRFAGPRIATKNTHGTGCTLSAAVALFLAQRLDLPEAIAHAKAWLEAALASADALTVGGGHGPVDHFHGLHRR